MMETETAQQALVFDASGAKAGADEFERAGKRIIAANGETVAATERVVAAMGRQEKSILAIARVYAPAIAEQERMRKAQENLNRIVEGGGAKAELASRVLAEMTAAQQRATVAVTQATGAQTAAARALIGHSAANENASGSMRSLRGALGQVGFQAQDVATQISMGTDALQVLSIQGAQLAGAFGPTGAVIGGVIAVVGLLGAALLGHKTAAQAAEEAQKALNRTVASSVSSVEELTAKYNAMTTAQKEFERLTIGVALKEQENAMRTANKELSSMLSGMSALVREYEYAGSFFAGTEEYTVNSALTESGFKQAQAVAALKAAIGGFNATKDAVALGNDLKAVSESGTDLGDKIRANINEALVDLITKSKDAAEVMARLDAQLKVLGGDSAAASNALKDQEATIAKATKSLEDRAKLYGAESAALNGNTDALDAYNREKARAEEYEKSYADALKSGVGGAAAAAKATEMAGKAVDVFNKKLAAQKAEKAGNKAESEAERDAKAYAKVTDELARQVEEQRGLLAAATENSVVSQRQAETQKAIGDALAKAKTTAETTRGAIITDQVTTLYTAKYAVEDERALVQKRQSLALSERELQFSGLMDAARDRAIQQIEDQAYATRQWGSYTEGVGGQWYTLQERIRDAKDRTDEATRAAKLWRDAVTDIAGSASDGVRDAFKEMALEGKSAWEVFENSAGDAIDKVYDMLWELAITNPLKNALTGATGKDASPTLGTGGIGGLFSWIGDLFHEGGVVGGEPTGRRALPAGTWNGAPRYHSGGVAGLMPGEVPAILMRGETVLTEGQMAALRAPTITAPIVNIPPTPVSSAPVVNFSVTNNASSDTTVSQGKTTVGSDGSLNVELIVDRAVAKSISTTGAAGANAMKTVYGARRKLTGR